jgi:hypothetical protein
VGLGALVGVALDAALGVGFRVTPAPAPQAAVKAANDVSKTTHR